MRVGIASLWLVLSCGGSHAVVQTRAAPPKHDDAWHDLGFEDRHSVMTFTVLPNMARSWRQFRNSEYPAMTCRTCHGKDAEAVSYRMPNPSLRTIDVAHPPSGPAAEFMKSRVVPDMIDLIGTRAEHFDCNSCHPKAQKS